LPPLKPHHVGISVGDLEASIAWYSDMLGFSLEEVGAIPEGRGRVAILRAADFRVELFEVPGAAPLPEERRDPQLDLCTHGTKHIAFEVEDIVSLVADLRRRGADIVWETVHAGYAVVFVRDNTGNLVELMQPSGGRGANEREAGSR
jgi:methylmalonyl-CoA/ethylmalonyl-CoA epimerase